MALTEYKLNIKHPKQRLYDVIQLEKKDINLLIALTFGYGLVGIATPIAVQALVNVVTMGGVLQPLYIVSTILFALLVLSGSLYVFEGFIVELIQRRLFIRASLNVAKNAQNINTSLYDDSNPVELMNRFFDISIIQKSTATLLTVGLAAFLQGVIGSIVLVFYSLYFAIIVLIVIAMLSFIIFVLGHSAMSTAIEESKTKYATAEWLETIARNIYIFKFFNGLERTERISNELASNYLKKRKIHFRTLLFQNIGAVTLYAIVGTSMLALGGGLVIKGQINLGQFVAAELIIFGVLAAFARFINKLEYYYDMLASLDKIGFLDDLPQEENGTIKTDSQVLECVEVSNISYQFHPRVKLIENLNFYISKGESLSIIGESGVGKTTLVEILTGLRAPSVGHIKFNGYDLRQLEKNSLRNMIGIAGRIEVIEGSILDNIVLDRIRINLNEVNLVIKELGLDVDFARLSKGLDTKLTAFGAPLSTTQLQRLMLARAIVSKPALLVIDGLLDNLTPIEIDSIINLLNNHTKEWMLLVTTRLENIANKFDCSIRLN